MGAGEPHSVLVLGQHLSAHTNHRTPSEDLALRLQSAGHPVIACSRRASGLGRLADILVTITNRRRHYDVAIVDVFSGASFRFADLSTRMLQLLGKKIILTLHGGNLPQLADHSPNRVRRLLERAHIVTSPSDYLAERMAGFGLIRVIPNPIDLAQFAAVDRHTRVPGRIAWVRAFHQLYRPVDAVDVLAEVRNRGADASLVMIGTDKGDGSLQRLKKRIAELGLGAKVKLYEEGLPHSSIAEQLRQASVFLNTTSADNAPVSVLEALAAEVPVVSTNAGGLPYLLEHQRTGLLAEVGAVEQLAQSTTQILTDPELQAVLAMNGRDLAADFDWSKVLPAWQRAIVEAHETSER